MLDVKDLNVFLVHMSVSIPKPINEDWRTKLARDDAEQRKIRVKNIARDDKQAEANLIFKKGKATKAIQYTITYASASDHECA